MCCGQKHQIQHGWNELWLETSDSAWLKCVVVKSVRFSMAGMNVLWLETSDSAWLECFMVISVRFSMAGMCCGKKRQIQHGASEGLEYFSLPA
jgi:hypothetical protein